jgi:hypothetical protein
VLVGLAVVAAIGVLVVAARVARRRRRDEIRSVGHYHERLDTLHVESEDRGGSVRVVDDVPPPTAHAPPDRPRLDPDDAHVPEWRVAPHPRERRRYHDQQWAMRRMQPRARVDTGTILVVAIVVAVLVAIALAGYLIQHGRTTSTTTSTTSSTTTSSTTTSTTTPAATLQASSVTGGLATYPVAHATYTVVVSASGREWLQLTVPPLSANVTTKVLAPGGTETATVTGPSDLELGAPGVASVRVDGALVVLPTSYTPPLTLRFAPG